LLEELKATPPRKCNNQTNISVVIAMNNKWANMVTEVALIWKLRGIVAQLETITLIQMDLRDSDIPINDSVYINTK